jgi:hypothetical protein
LKISKKSFLNSFGILKPLLILLLFFRIISFHSQVIPSDRFFPWSSYGLRDTNTLNFNNIDLSLYPIDSIGVNNNDSLIQTIISDASSSGYPGLILSFPSGTFLFNESINLPNNTVLKGYGASSTTLKFDLNGSNHCINISGNVLTDTSAVIANGIIDSSFLFLFNTSQFSVGDWIRIIQTDDDLVQSTWAHNTVGQITQILSIDNNKIHVSSDLRMDYDLARSPYVKKMNPVKNVGLECLKIERVDISTNQVSNLKYSRAVNCWVSGIESEKCNFSHIDAEYSSNISISKSYFHDAHNYGNGGKAYGVMLHFTTNECLIEDNIFNHLRHSMIVQAGANGNVFAYNYSFDPFWTDVSFIIPSNSAGEIVLHGNWPFANLFEQNIVDNIVIDNSHGANGPYNTLFRNRAKGYGLFFSDATSPNQNIIGNEITNNSLPSPYDLFIYNLNGSGHFVYGNNNLGTIDPLGTDSLQDISYAYDSRPDFIPISNWASIGIPNVIESGRIPSFDRYQYNVIFGNSCGMDLTKIEPNNLQQTSIYPNPFNSELKIENNRYSFLKVYDLSGRLVFENNQNSKSFVINTDHWNNGIYLMNFYNGKIKKSFKVVKEKF